MNLIKLKPDKFEYCGKTYVQQRWVSDDYLFYFTSDDLDYVRVYKAININWDIRPGLMQYLYHDCNPYSYPIYDIQSAIAQVEKNLENGRITLENKFEIHPSHFKNKKA